MTERIAGQFGRLPRDESVRTLPFAAYPSLLPEPMDAWNTLPLVEESLAVSDRHILYPPMGNDRVGDCCVCAAMHAETVQKGRVGKRSIAAAQDVIDAYFKMSGGRDSGLPLTTVLKQGAVGLLGSKIEASLAIDPADKRAVSQAIQFFGGVYIGFNVQRNAVSDFQHGRPWTPGPNTGGGHCVYVTGHNADGIECLTWGFTQKGTWAWWNPHVYVVHAVFFEEATVYESASMEL
jgi:hypothetical protein